MKVLIWVGCFLAATILNTLLGYATGIKVGYFIFYIGVYFVAKKLCEKWDQRKHKGDSAESDDSVQTQSEQENAIESIHNSGVEETVSDINKICFCRKCGEKLIDNSRFCRKCGTEIIDVSSN